MPKKNKKTKKVKKVKDKYNIKTLIDCLKVS